MNVTINPFTLAKFNVLAIWWKAAQFRGERIEVNRHKIRTAPLPASGLSVGIFRSALALSSRDAESLSTGQAAAWFTGCEIIQPPNNKPIFPPTNQLITFRSRHLRLRENGNKRVRLPCLNHFSFPWKVFAFLGRVRCAARRGGNIPLHPSRLSLSRAVETATFPSASILKR